LKHFGEENLSNLETRLKGFMLEIFMHQVLYILESEVQSLNDFIQTW
jgi:hypothetical protein